MGLREKWQKFRQEWANTPVPTWPEPKPLQPNGTGRQWGCDEPTYGSNRICNTHIACM